MPNRNRFGWYSKFQWMENSMIFGSQLKRCIWNYWRALQYICKKKRNENKLNLVPSAICFVLFPCTNLFFCYRIRTTIENPKNFNFIFHFILHITKEKCLLFVLNNSKEFFKIPQPALALLPHFHFFPFWSFSHSVFSFCFELFCKRIKLSLKLYRYWYPWML